MRPKKFGTNFQIKVGRVIVEALFKFKKPTKMHESTLVG
jgi:hypothetical protein